MCGLAAWLLLPGTCFHGSIIGLELDGIHGLNLTRGQPQHSASLQRVHRDPNRETLESEIYVSDDRKSLCLI